MLSEMSPILRAELEKPENADIFFELNDSDYLTRQHYSRATYALGCRGPMCRKAEKDRGRRRNEIRATRQGRKYIPKEEIRKTDRDALMDFIIHWHLTHPDEIQRRTEARSA